MCFAVSCFFTHCRTFFLLVCSHLLAWSSPTKPQALSDYSVKQDRVEPTATFGVFIQFWLLNAARRLVYGTAHNVKSRVMGERDAMYRLVGPGEFWIASRPGPRWMLGGLVDAYAGLREAGERVRAQRRSKSQQ